MKKISLSTAIFININIILGAGLFINPVPLTKIAGSLGFLSYPLSALILLPIVLSILKLAQKYPYAGGIYIYSKESINPLVGFISGWSYFLGKTVSPALLTHIFVLFFQRRIPFLQNIPILLLDCLLIFFLIFINIFGVSIGGKIQYFFTTLKIIPILFVIFAGSIFFNPDFFVPKIEDFINLFSTLPIAIFAMISFEMTCSIGHLLENPQKNIGRAVLYSFIIVVSILFTFQLTIFGFLGNDLARISEPILTFGIKLFSANSIIPKLINSFVFASILGGSFGSLTSNCWNLYALAKDKHFFFNNIFLKKNKLNIPWVSLLTEGTIACLLLSITKNQVPLQNMTVFGVVIAYLLTSISFFISSKKQFSISFLISILAILSSSYIFSICLKNLFLFGISFPFLMLFIIGIGMAILKYKKNLNF